MPAPSSSSAWMRYTTSLFFFPFFPFFSQSTVHIHQKRKWGKKGPEKGRKIP
jgi:hypothetical protein